MKKLKDGWESVRLGDIAITVTSGSRDWAQYYSDTGAKFIRMTNLNRNGITLLLDDLKFVNIQSNSADGKRTSLQANDILISITAELGKIGFIPENFGEAYINQHTALIRIDPNKAHAKFIAYVLSSATMNKTINSLNDAGAKAGLNLPTIKTLSLKLPSIEEQIQIAETLSTWDNAIQTTEKLLENSRRQKKVLMQKLLNGKDWKKVKLGSIADMSSGGTPKSNIAEYYNGDILWVSIADMTTQGKYITRTEKTISKLGLENSSAKLYPENTILYAMYASIGECSIATKPVTSSQAILGIRPKKELHFEYLYFYLSSLKDKMKLQGQQGTQSNLNSRMVKEFDILLPSFEEQQKIAEILSTADQEIETLQRKLECLKLEKGALMQRLLA
ncbi:restriction endonuclease subunit S [Actinobacillus porcinus]|uniref:restriction endonuclease subunit S n=1 Tax=Actinobacillus porcinus TaxID=51048 RepID=UPI0023F183AB|nr:restriction endonuclease subunit S [Actinobacillus porcinus]MDD7545682.1 restriction endonuclease subunit S [Actinobacillus porcinus]MDY5848946.1 restriction endonuclease subunit S [Actinobacillus porcinus]